MLHRRVLLVMLPAMEKSPDELAGLGKIIVAAKKTLFAIGLGARLEGSHREVIAAKPTHADSPFMDLNDEYGYYAVKGYAVVAAQGRSIGVSIGFGGQDTPSFGKASKEEAQAVFANTLTKVAMRIEDAGETFELFQKTAGEALVTQTAGFTQHGNALISNYYHDNRAAGVERRNRIDLRDIRAQTQGQAHVFHGETIVRAQLFFAAIPTAHAYRLNRFLPVQPVNDETLAETQTRLGEHAISEALAALAAAGPVWLASLAAAAGDTTPPAAAVAGWVAAQVTTQAQDDRASADAIDALVVNATPSAPAWAHDGLPMTGLLSDDEADDGEDAGVETAAGTPLPPATAPSATGRAEPVALNDPDGWQIDAALALSLANAPADLAERLAALAADDPLLAGVVAGQLQAGQRPAEGAALLWPAARPSRRERYGDLLKGKTDDR